MDVRGPRTAKGKKKQKRRKGKGIKKGREHSIPNKFLVTALTTSEYTVARQ